MRVFLVLPLQQNFLMVSEIYWYQNRRTHEFLKILALLNNYPVGTSIAFICYKNTCLTIHVYIETYVSHKKICITSEAYKEDQSNGSNLYNKTLMTYCS